MTGPSVLVIDDDADIRDTLLEVLEENGYDAVGAANGRIALDLLQGGKVRPRLILLDLMMPVMDGITFREEQLRDPALAPIPVVVLSAYRDAPARGEALGVTAALGKPLRLEELLELVRIHASRPETG